MAKKKEFKVPNGKKPIFGIFRCFLRLFFRKPKVINLAGEIEERAIVLANHSNKSGPPSLDLYYPKKCVKWGAHEMFGNYKSRRDYLKNVLYLKKNKSKKFKAVVMSTLMATVSQYIYKGMRMLPTYQDMRFATTIRNSMKCLDANMSVMVFPEDSNDGYKEVLTDFFPGFVPLADKYYKSTGVDVPIYPVYLHVKKRVLVIGKPTYMQELVAQGMDKFQISKYFCERVNELFFDYIKDKDEK